MTYTRLPVADRRRALIAAGSSLFAEHAFDEISMRQIAAAAGISKPLLYHYFPSKTELFKAAVRSEAEELGRLLEPTTGAGRPVDELAVRLDTYLAWIETHAGAWSKLMRTAATLPVAREIVDDFRARTLARILDRLGDGRPPPPARRNAVRGWLGGVDAAILDWIEHGDLTREQLRDLLLATFEAAVAATAR
jgi:AcrR family transcriptional regulator